MGGGTTFGVTNDKQLCKSYRKCVLLPSEDSILRNTRNPNQYTSWCYTHGEKGGEMNMYKLLKEINELKGHYQNIIKQKCDSDDEFEKIMDYSFHASWARNSYNRIITLLNDACNEPLHDHHDGCPSCDNKE